MQFEQRFAAMGTTVETVVEAAEVPVAVFVSIRLLFERQESTFSRFRPATLLSRLNSGDEVEDRALATACRIAIEAHEFTAGLFNPMILPALEAAGYRRTFSEVKGGTPRPQAVPGPRECLFLDGDRVRLKDGQLDLGGIVKGWTVDLAVESFGAEVAGLLVNAGGDLRCSGNDGERAGWQIEVEGPGGVAWSGEVTGALATSSVLRRQWFADDGSRAHHLIDPRSGLPATPAFAQVSALGPLAWRAECWAKAVLIGGVESAAAAQADGYRILAIGGDGRIAFAT